MQQRRTMCKKSNSIDCELLFPLWIQGMFEILDGVYSTQKYPKAPYSKKVQLCTFSVPVEVCLKDALVIGFRNPRGEFTCTS